MSPGSKRTGGGSFDGKQQEEVHHKVPRPTAQRDARLFSMLGSFVAAHDEVPRERFERLINPNGTAVIPAVPSAVEDPSPAGGAASAEQQHRNTPARL